MILVVSHPDDPHAQVVIERIAALGHDVRLFDLSDLPARASLTFDYTGPAPAVEFDLDGESPLPLHALHSVWWRRPQVPEVNSIADHDAAMFAANEWNEALGGLWQLLDGARWMNNPVRDEAASRKAHQLRVAAEVGLQIPATVITSNPQRARRFIERHGVGRTIFKTFSCTHAVWRETRLVREDDLALLDAVRLAPVIFQEYVPAGVDLRVTVVGERLFAAAIDATGTDYPVDFRMSLGQAVVEPVELPDEVAKRLLLLMERLGLVYGAIDVRRTPGGDHVFLEVNTAGEFLFVEERTGLPISGAIAEWLSAPASR